MSRLRWIICVSLLVGSVVSTASDLFADYPEKPLKIVVYTSPGGLIDVTARKAAYIMQKNYTSVPVIVENKKGAGGLIALTHVLGQPADGHTIFGLTSSVISRVVGARKETKLAELEFISRMAGDYESLIVGKDTEVGDFKLLLAHAHEKQGRQVWVGPSAGGTDHLFAQKVWKATGMRARWVPYRSGSEAVAALLGGHGSVYVGNPGDTIGRPDLKIVAVSAPQRLDQFPAAPTFSELGFDGLTGETLWRGFAVRRGIPRDRVAKLEALLNQVVSDPEWLEFLRSNALLPFSDTRESFAQAVNHQIVEDKQFLG